MANYFNIPRLWPFKMIPVTTTPGIHFDDLWSHEQLKSWQVKSHYFQKWVRTDTTPLQVEGNVAPAPLRILNAVGVQVKTIAWVEKIVTVNYKIWELTFDISDQATNAKYFVHSKATLGGFNSEYISECIWVKDAWADTLLFTYKNSYNRSGVAWVTGIQGMKFRVEGWLCPLLEAKRVRTDFINQVRTVAHLSGTYYRVFKLFVAGTDKDVGVAPWVIDLMGRILSECDSIDISGKKFQTDSGSEFEIWKVNTYSLMACSIDVVEGANSAVSQTVSDVPVGTNIIVTYQIKTRFFGGEQLVPITDYKQE